MRLAKPLAHGRGRYSMMNSTRSLLAPIMLLFAGWGGTLPGAACAAVSGVRQGFGGAGQDILPTAHQVRIEQHFSIRITPGAPVMPPEMLDEIEQGPSPERPAPRRMDQCVLIAGIGAVHGAQGNRLLLFMRDQHIVVAALEKACRAEDFYSGFYVARNGDGLLCTNRDRLQSRSGANCRLKTLNELSPRPWRRFP